jgi:hypothetical protein
MGLGYGGFGEWGISFYLSLLKHPFTAFGRASPPVGEAAGGSFGTRRFPVLRDLCESGLVDDLVARTGFLHAGLGPVGGVYLCRIALDRWVLGLLWGQSYSAP